MHHGPSPSLAATLRALRGETDLQIIASALHDPRFARILALAPNVDSVVGALGALAGGLPDVIPAAGRDSPALSAAVASLIGTDTGECILLRWAEVAPAGWGAPHATALTNAVHDDRCTPWVAAALIGPCDASAALLHASWDIVCAVRRWGQTTPDDPTAWMNALTPAERDRLMSAICAVRSDAIRCLPWLPEASAADIVDRIGSEHLSLALATYIAASPVARARHTDVLTALIQRIRPYDLAALTRLAAASHMEGAWDAVVRLLRANPWSAVNVVVAAPWDNLRADVQETILSAAAPNDVCAAIAFARGDHTDAPAHGTILDPSKIASETVRAFFAAITPTVWDALPKEKQRVWLSRLSDTNAHLAVRSLGHDPAFLAHTRLNDDVIAAVRRSTRDDNDLRHTLLPVAVRDLPIAALPVVVAALPPPSDPVAFIQIAGGSPTMPPALRAWITAHPTPQAMAAASTVLRAAARLATDPVADRCAALAAALAGWSREETGALLAALPDDAHAALRPDSNALACALARPDRRDAFRQALDALAALPPSAALPSLHALDALTQATESFSQRQAGASLAQALRNHGDGFLALVDALADTPRKETFPRPRSATCVAVVRTIAAADPLAAYRLAHALQSRSPTAMLDVLAAAPLDKMLHLWRVLPKALQQSALGDRHALTSAAAAPGGADALMQTLRAWEEDNDPLPLLALRMLIDDNPDRRARGVALLAQQPDLAVSLLPLLHHDLRMLLERDSHIAVAGADLPPSRPSASAQRRRR
jgi:hypothetical protein